MKKILSILILTLGIGLLFTACDPSHTPEDLAPTMLESIANNADLSTFRLLIETAGLSDTLNNRSNLTIFAPTNAAFEAYRATSGYSQLTSIPVADLRQLLLYHLVPTRLKSNDFLGGYLPTLSLWGVSKLPLEIYFNTDGGFQVNGSEVTSVDNITQTGYIHIVNSVLTLPVVVNPIQNDPSFSSFLQALTRADLDIDYIATLSDASLYTIFAPSNLAFSDLLTEIGYSTINDIPVDRLNAILQYHIVRGTEIYASNLSNFQEVTTLGGNKFSITDGTKITDNLGRTGRLIIWDRQTTNGVIQRVDKVMLPN